MENIGSGGKYGLEVTHPASRLADFPADQESCLSLVSFFSRPCMYQYKFTFEA